MTETQRGMRASAISVLRFISSREAQLKLKREAPFVQVPDEVICMWADDTYGFSRRDDFRNAFSADELSAMAAFNEILEEVADLVAERNLSLEEFLAMPESERLADAARNALQAFEAPQANSEGPPSGPIQP